MINRIVITDPSDNSYLDVNAEETSIFYIKDYIQIANIADARRLTDKIFSYNVDFIAEYDYKGYKVTWSWYSDVFQFCIKYLEIKALIDKIESLNIHKIIVGEIDPQYKKVLNVYFFNKNVTSNPLKSELLLNLKQILFNVVMLSFSIVSILFFILRPGRNIGTYNGDFIYKNTKSDFRLNHLYEKYEHNSTQYIEFIRSTRIKDFFVNAYKRRRFAIYYTAIIFFVDLLSKKDKYSKQPKDFYQSVLYSYHSANIVLKKSTLIIERIFKILRIDKFVLISFNSRSAHLSFAAKSLGIKTIGIMHGLQQKDYAVYEFMQSYQEKKKIGCDVYGVWSGHYLEYFRKYSKISNSNIFQYSGLLRPVNNINKVTPFKRVSEKNIKVLIISEPLVSVMEIIPYLKCLIKHDDIELAIKVRPMVKDLYYEEMKIQLPYIKNLEVYDGKIEEAGKEFDVFVGSNSTAVIEASLFGKISILLNTVKFGDYFGMDELIHGGLLLVKDPELLYKEINYRVEKENDLKTIEKIRYRFFGDNKDGSQWIIDQL